MNERFVSIAMAAMFSASASLFAQAPGNHARAEADKTQTASTTQAQQWPSRPQAPSGAPNVVLILIDDVGYGATSTFGGIISTPTFEQLAQSGLRYNNFHVNSLCSPTRAALLSGRNNHEIGYGTVAEASTGYPGYDDHWGKEAASIPEVLGSNGYSTAAFGKWHNTPLWDVNPVGPFDKWPTGRGFDYFYGFIKAADNQYYTRIYRDTAPVEPAATPQQGYDFTTDITNDAIHWIHAHDAVSPDKPFFLYFATGATHEPHQVPHEWIAKYKGKFDEGWDKLREESFARQKKLGVIPANAELTPRPAGLPAWDSLSADEKKLVAHQAEVYAGYAEQADYEVGRLLAAIKQEGKSDNTLVLEIFGDNGGSAEGGLEGHDLLNSAGAAAGLSDRLGASDDLGSELFTNHYAAAWAWALSSPFQGTKQDASHLGGTTDPLVVSWPARIKASGELRTQFQHVIDVAPTIYEAVGVKPPDTFAGEKQIPLAGSSFLYTFDHPGEPSHHHVQYFSTSGNRAIYKDGWWAGNRYWSTWEPRGAWSPGEHPDIDQHPWELYNLNEDFSQAHDLAASNPEKLKELQALFKQEAEKNHAFPILPTLDRQLLARQPNPVNGRTTFTYREGVERLNGNAAPPVTGRSHLIAADVSLPAQGGNGVIVAQGGRYGGFTLFVKDRHVFYEVTAYGKRVGRIVSWDLLPAGPSHIELQVTPDATPQDSSANAVFAPGRPRPGKVLLTVNGKQQQEEFANVVGPIGSETFDVGSDLGSAVSTDYTSPNRFSGTIEKVTVELQ
jgi:arylsulfatase A-like enzyme